MKPKEIIKGRIYKNGQAFYLGISSMNVDAACVRIAGERDKGLVIIRSLKYPGHVGGRVVPYARNPNFWAKFVLTDKEFKCIV